MTAGIRVTDQKLPIAVIGSGFSGTIAAIQLSRTVACDRPILLCERSESFALGLAYATSLPHHLLNVRAANMSAFPAEPRHFEAWLAQEGAGAHHTEAGAFASRGTYGRYLKAILLDAICRCDLPGQLRPLPDAVVDLVPTAEGYELVGAGGRRFRVAGAVLATGHVPPPVPADPRHVTDPWRAGATTGLDPDLPVLILGLGLTMVDILLALRAGGFRGPVVALSRRGLLPQRHRATRPWPMPDFAAEERRSVRQAMRRLRREVAAAAAHGVDWRAVVDSIRPITAELWRGWPEAEQRRFLRHVRRWWDIHRHRMAPPNADALEAELAAGSLRTVAGRVKGMRFEADAVRVDYQGVAGPAELSVQRVISATGLESAVRTTDPFMRSLVRRGLVRWDRLGFGIDVSDGLEAIGRDGRPVRGLWALGPVTRGIFWECIAVPDIREQAERLARIAAAALEEPSPAVASSAARTQATGTAGLAVRPQPLAT